jgi:hypothetical protein
MAGNVVRPYVRHTICPSDPPHSNAHRSTTEAAPRPLLPSPQLIHLTVSRPEGLREELGVGIQPEGSIHADARLYRLRSDDRRSLVPAGIVGKLIKIEQSLAIDGLME